MSEPIKLKLQQATATPPPVVPTTQQLQVVAGEVVTESRHPLMDQIQSAIDTIIDLCNDENEDAEEILLQVITHVEELEELLRKRGVVR